MIKVDFQNRAYVAQKAAAVGFQAILFTDHETPDQVRETLKLITPKSPEYDGKFGYPNARWIGYHPELKQMDYAAMNGSNLLYPRRRYGTVRTFRLLHEPWMELSRPQRRYQRSTRKNDQSSSGAWRTATC